MPVHLREAWHQVFACAIHARCGCRSLRCRCGTDLCDAAVADDDRLALEYTLTIHGDDIDVLEYDSLARCIRGHTHDSPNEQVDDSFHAFTSVTLPYALTSPFFHSFLRASAPLRSRGFGL